jgi:hypothetical protein
VFVAVPLDLSEDLSIHFRKHGQLFEPENTGEGSDGFMFPESEPGRITALLRQWRGLPYVFGP